MPGRILALAWLCATVLAAAETDLVPKRGRGTPPPNPRGNGPWLTRVMLATSTNGLDFQRLHFVLSDQAGVPNVVVSPEGRARIYYIDFGNDNVLACATQSAGSLTNWEYRRVRISGLPEKQVPPPVDPCVVMVPTRPRAASVQLAPPERQQNAGGTLYRLYFMQAAPLPSFYSAISSNGLDFVKEEGVRFTARPEPCFDPLVLQTKNEWRLWGGGRRQTFFAESSDGLDFTSAGEFRIEAARFMPWSAVALPKEAGYRLFGNFIGPGEWSGGVSSVFSRDGKRWEREPGIRLSLDGSRYSLESGIAPDNGCALLPNGTWLMAYLATIPEPRRR